MLHHIAVFQLQPDATPGQVQAVVDGLRGLPDQVPSIRGYEVGTDVGVTDGAYDLVVDARFDDADGYRAYIDHPAHRQVADQLLAPIRTARAVIQFEGS